MRMQRKFYSVVGTLALVIFFVACTSAPVAPTTSPLVSPLVSPLAGGEEGAGSSLVSALATPMPGKASVMGVLIVLDPTFGTPQGEGSGVYLVPTTEPPSDDLKILEITDESYKAGVLDSKSGRFVFSDVLPGAYQMLVVTSAGTFPARSTETKKWLQYIVVEADQVLDLSMVQYP